MRLGPPSPLVHTVCLVHTCIPDAYSHPLETTSSVWAPVDTATLLETADEGGLWGWVAHQDLWTEWGDAEGMAIQVFPVCLYQYQE